MWVSVRSRTEIPCPELVVEKALRDGFYEYNVVKPDKVKLRIFRDRNSSALNSDDFQLDDVFIHVSLYVFLTPIHIWISPIDIWIRNSPKHKVTKSVIDVHESDTAKVKYGIRVTPMRIES